MRYRIVGSVVIFLILTGCIGNEDSATPREPAGDEGAEAAAPVFEAPALVAQQVARYGIADEPTVSVAPDGTIYVSAKFAFLHEYLANDPGNARVWRSDDGVSFTLLNDVTGTLAEGSQGNQDTDLYVDASGVIHLADLNVQAGKPAGVPYLQSTDRGETWKEVAYLRVEGTTTDRQWIAGQGDRIVIIWRATSTLVGAALSEDKGRTWDVSTVDVEHRKLGNVVVANGTIAFAVTRGESSIVVVRSDDNGETWSEETISVESPGMEPILFPTLAMDGAGHAFAAVTLGERSGTAWTSASIFVSDSAPNGTWAPLTKRTEAPFAMMPSMIGRADGGVAMSYLGTEDAGDLETGTHAWHVFVDTGVSRGATMSWATRQVSVEPAHEGGICTRGGGCPAFGRLEQADRTMGEIFEIAEAPDGRLMVTWPDTSFERDGMSAILFAAERANTELA